MRRLCGFLRDTRAQRRNPLNRDAARACRLARADAKAPDTPKA